MRILGIDPGYAIVGCGILDYVNTRFRVVHYQAITTEAGEVFADRLLTVYEELEQLIELYKPQAMAVEELFFHTNQKTGIAVAQARGVILLAAKKYKLELYEYTPLQVKQAVVGYGRAEKKQVMEMTRMLLNLKKIPKPDDVADALAIAICHAHNSGSALHKMLKHSK